MLTKFDWDMKSKAPVLVFELNMQFHVERNWLIDSDFLKLLLFTNKASFHINGQVSHLNCWILCAEQPYEVSDYICVTPKLNVLWTSEWPYDRTFLYCGKRHEEKYLHQHIKIVGFLKVKGTKSAKETAVVLKHDNAPSHFSHKFCYALDATFPNQWTG
jgi:hypothetical protein